MTRLNKEVLRYQTPQEREWEALTYAQKNEQLFLKQKKLLEEFLSRHAISQEQYDKSYYDLTRKMRVTNLKG